jgi:hypothetical protein
MDRSLLILGAPGSGKTTLLLELARDLLARAADDPTHPIPVVFPLSTWAQSRKPLAEWLEDELSLRYDVPRKIARKWVPDDQILPLLDGLDEVEADRRAACVEAINAFRQAHGFLPLVITSRNTDYESLAVPLRLHGAILVSPLTHEQADRYLSDLGPAGDPVRAALHDDPSLWELLDSPLLLNIVTVAYAGPREAPAPMGGTVSERRDYLFGSYVDQMLSSRASARKVGREQSVHWLTWLAYQMSKHGQTVFYLERLQQDWLPRSQHKAIRICNRLVVVLLIGPFFGLAGALPIIALKGDVVAALGSGLVLALSSGMLFGFGFSRQHEVSCVEKVTWSWSGFEAVLPKVLVVGLVAGLTVGLTYGVMYGLIDGMICGVIYGSVFGPVLGTAFGLTFGEIETRVRPNEGMHRSAKTGLTFGLTVGLIVGLIFGLVFTLIALPVYAQDSRPARAFVAGLYFASWFGLFCGAFAGLGAGGNACVRHLVLRPWLIRNGSTPWNYVRFLDYAAEKILLRKVGGGYAFLHRMLLEYFAARYVDHTVTTAQRESTTVV